MRSFVGGVRDNGSMSNPYDPNTSYGGNYQPAPYGQPYPPATVEHPQGTTILVLGIIGVFVSIVAPFAWIMGNKAMKEIRSSGVAYANEQNVNIGRILGMVFTILLIIGVVFSVVALIIFGIAAANSSS